MLSASGYENGLRAGREVAGRWEPPLTSLVENWRLAVVMAPSMFAPRPIAEARKNLDRWSQDDALDYAADLHRRKLEALPDLRVFPELKGMDQYLDEEARGFADGAGIDLRWVLLDRYAGEVYHAAMDVVPPTGRAGVPDGRAFTACSEFYFADTPDGPVLGKGIDDILLWHRDRRSPAPPIEPVLYRQPSGRGYDYVDYPYVNEHGLCVEEGGGALYELEPAREEVVFPVNYNDLVLRHCSTVDEATELLTRYNAFWGPVNYVVGDAEGRCAVIEKSRFQYAVRHGDGFVHTTYGGCDDATMRDICDTSSPVFRYYERRHGRMDEIISNAVADLSVATLWDAMLHHDAEAPGCQHVETLAQGVDLLTVAAWVVVPRRGRRLSRNIDFDGECVSSYICTNPTTEVRFQFA